MKLTKREAQILGILIEEGRNFSIGELAERLGAKESNASRWAKKLERYKLTESAKTRTTRRIRAQRSQEIEFAKAKEKLPGIRVEEILQGKTPFVLAHFQPHETRKISDIDLPHVSAKRIFSRLRKLGIVHMAKKGVYQVRDEAKKLPSFCANILIQMHIAEAERELGSIAGTYASFESANAPEFVFVTARETNPEHYWPTAYTALRDYGVRIILAGKYYYSNRKPGITDIIIHLLSIDYDARSIMYAAAAMIRNPFDYKKLLARDPFLLSRVQLRNVIDFVENKGKISSGAFPAWEEVEGV